ncbi:MAG: hypothetical protein K2X77_18475 [Candidatus Obscuribacterales bacterium]|jgi:hypothetical protein|nr:hypothetical protein [Candidatus Obscuribacterales bacterium]
MSKVLCAYKNCELEADDRFPVLILYAPKSYGFHEPSRMEMDIPHCEAHRAAANAKGPSSFLGDQAKETLTLAFRNAGRVVPDFDRTLLVWLAKPQMSIAKPDAEFSAQLNERKDN